MGISRPAIIPVDGQDTDLRNLAALKTSALVKRMLEQRSEQRLSALRSLTQAITDAAHECEVTVTSRLQAALTVSLADLKTEVEQTRTALQGETEQVKILRHQCEKAQCARARAEEAWEQAEAECHMLKMAFERRIRELEAALDAELATAPPALQEHRNAQGGALRRPLRLVEGAPARLAAQGDTEERSSSDERRSEPVHKVTHRTNERVDDRVRAELSTYVTHLLDNVEAMYLADLAVDTPPAQLVERLTSSLRDAQDVYEHRRAAMGVSDGNLFDERLTAVVDARATRSFGRHLAVAAYAVAAGQGVNPQIQRRPRGVST